MDAQRIPAHVRNPKTGTFWLKGHDVACDPAKAACDFMLKAALGYQLHADANSKKRPSLADDGFREGLNQAVAAFKTTSAVGESPNTRQHNSVGRRHHFGVRSHHDGSCVIRFLTRTFERFLRRMEVSGPVIDDCD